ncbi:MAG: intradiol ring-cleavage dioxygenase [Rubrivivax sp.]
MTLRRRPLLLQALGAAAALGAPALVAAAATTVLPPMTDGPFYPSPRWRDRPGGSRDWDADLTRVAGAAAPARGEHLSLELTLADARGRVIDGAEVEIWQCDTLAAYRHPRVAADAGRFDPGFQGFGSARSGRDGGARFRTIRPVQYPGRTPHIHVKLRHPSFGETTSQLFVAGDPGNAGDFLWRQLDATAQQALAMVLQPAPAAAGGDPALRWVVQHDLRLPG